MRPTRLVKGLVSMLAADMGQGIYRVKQNHEASELLHLLGITRDRRTVSSDDIQTLANNCIHNTLYNSKNLPKR